MLACATGYRRWVTPEWEGEGPLSDEANRVYTWPRNPDGFHASRGSAPPHRICWTTKRAVLRMQGGPPPLGLQILVRNPRNTRAALQHVCCFASSAITVDGVAMCGLRAAAARALPFSIFALRIFFFQNRLRFSPVSVIILRYDTDAPLPHDLSCLCYERL